MSSKTFSYYLVISLLPLLYLVFKQFTPIYLFLLSLGLEKIYFKYQVIMHCTIKTDEVSLDYKNDLSEKRIYPMETYDKADLTS